jgi:hypothetical protein
MMSRMGKTATFPSLGGAWVHGCGRGRDILCPDMPPLHVKSPMDIPPGGRATRLDYASADAGRQ